VEDSVRLIPENYNCSPWLGAIMIAGVAVAFAFLVVYSARLRVASDNATEQQLQAASNDVGPASSHQTQWW
jgi:hypothetical protein